MKGPPTEAERARLRPGFSTGTAATAAAMAAARLLDGEELPKSVSVRLPNGDDIVILVAEGERLADNAARAMVIKDAGDDPDVTNRARIRAMVSASKTPGLLIVGGPGVGKVTKPGLVLPPGVWAVNPGPRAMLNENLAPFMGQRRPGLRVEISVDGGEALAQKTLNPRLGIVGGISILGTTGLVKPFSHEAYTATIENALDVARAEGLCEAVLTTGGQSENFAMRERSDLPEEAFVQIADYFAEGLKTAAGKGFEKIGLAVFFGKAVKQAAGHAYTHAHKTDLDVSDLLSCFPDLLEEAGAEIAASPTARAALDVLRDYGRLDLVANVAEKMLVSARSFTGPGPALWALIFDYDGTVLAYKNQ